MASVYVQFLDATQAVVVSVFGCPQNAAAYPNQATIDSSDARYVAFMSPAATPAALAQAALAAKLAAGIALTSTSTPALNATYALDAVSTAEVYQIGLYASQFSAFPSGGTTQAYPDITGAQHSFSVAAFIAFLKAVAPLVSTLSNQAGVMAQGGTPVWPAQTATIS